MKNPKHIVLFFTQDISLKSWKEAGLFEREVRPYLILAKERGWRITFLTYGDKSDLAFKEELAPIRICPLWKTAAPKSRLMKLLCAPFALRHHKAKLGDAAIYKTNQFWGGWNAVLAKWLWGGRVIARQGYEYLAFAKAQKKPYYQRVIAWALECFIYRCADQIVLATQQDKNFAIKTFPFLKGRPIDIQPNWIDFEHFKPAPESGDGYADLVYIGRLNPQKNVPSLIRAVAKTGYSLDIYGDGELCGELKALAQELKAKIRFMGWVANDEIPSLLAHYKIFILPSFFEGNPKALLEAMACAKPVIGSNVKGIQTLITHQENGVLCKTDEKSIMEAIEGLMKDKALRFLLGHQARKTIETSHSLTAFLEAEEKRYG